MSWGNILAITNSSGTDISGNANHIANLNPIRYRGYFYDVETGFYYLQSRYYDPVIGRFINLDGFVTTDLGFLSYNMYAYCANNPVMFVDPSGKCTKAWENGYQGPCPGQGLPGCMDNWFSNDGFIGPTQENNNTVQPVLDVTNAFNESLNKTANCLNSIAIAVERVPPPFNISLEFRLYEAFFGLVNHNAPWDIKRPIPWNNTIGTPFPGYNVPVLYMGKWMTPEQLGNYAFGYLGAACGFSWEILITGSYCAAGMPGSGAALNNEIGDWNSVMLGYLAGSGVY